MAWAYFLIDTVYTVEFASPSIFWIKTGQTYFNHLFAVTSCSKLITQTTTLGIRWHDFVRNSEVSLRTVSDRITRGRNAIFGQVARLPDNIPTHQAMVRQVELSVGRPPDSTWKRPPGRQRAKWTDQLRRDNNNVPIATLWRQAIGRGHSRATLRSEPTTR